MEDVGLCILWPVGLFYGQLVYLWPVGKIKAIWYILWKFGVFFPVLVCSIQKNLATLFPEFLMEQKRKIG
jgi:hypothetical protein